MRLACPVVIMTEKMSNTERQTEEHTYRLTGQKHIMPPGLGGRHTMGTTVIDYFRPVWNSITDTTGELIFLSINILHS